MKSKIGYILLFVFFFFFPAGLMWAQTRPSVRAEISPSSGMIGDHYRFDIEIEKDIVQVIQFPDFESGYMTRDIEILFELPVDTLSQDGRNVTIRKRYIVTTFEDGDYDLGNFPVLLHDKNLVDTIYSQGNVLLRVDTFEIDTETMAIYDIKEPLNVDVLPEEYIGYILLVYFGLQFIYAVIYILFRTVLNREKKTRAIRRPVEPPHITAIRELEKLHGEKLWQNNRHKIYYSRLTDIIREYIDGRYGVQAMEMTSYEIIAALRELNIPERSFGQLQRLLSTSDYVKFAKYIPSVEDNEMSYNEAFYFVEETKFLAPVEAELPQEGKERGI